MIIYDLNLNVNQSERQFLVTAKLKNLERKKLVPFKLKILEGRGDSMNGTPAASGKGLCAIDRV